MQQQRQRHRQHQRPSNIFILTSVPKRESVESGKWVAGWRRGGWLAKLKQGTKTRLLLLLLLLLPGLFTLKIGTAAKRSTYSCCRGLFRGGKNRRRRKPADVNIPLNLSPLNLIAMKKHCICLTIFIQFC